MNQIRPRLTELKQNILRTVASHIGTRATIVDGRLLIDGQLVWDLSIRESTYYGRGTGDKTNKLSVTVGDYGNNKTSYPQRKDSTHNYPEIAAKLVRCHDARMATTAASRKRDSNRSHVETLRDEFGYGSIWGFQATTEENKPVRAERKLVFSGTVDEVKAYIAAVDEVEAKFKK